MEPMDTPVGGTEQTVVCPNCANSQQMSGVDARCDRCGTLLDPAGSGEGGIVAAPTSAPADPDAVPPAMASSGIGGTNDGTQVARHAPTAVPGKPMAPIADEPAGHATDEGQTLGSSLHPLRLGRRRRGVTDPDPAVAARPGGRTYHLTPEEVWLAQAESDGYRPEAYDTDGFIHFTDGEVNLLAVANAFYQNDSRPHVVLVVDPARLTAPVRYDDPDRVYPHLYGPLNRDAVIEVRRAVRQADGSFVEIA